MEALIEWTYLAPQRAPDSWARPAANRDDAIAAFRFAQEVIADFCRLQFHVLLRPARTGHRAGERKAPSRALSRLRGDER